MSNMDYFQPLDKHVRVPLWEVTWKTIKNPLEVIAYLALLLTLLLIPVGFLWSMSPVFGEEYIKAQVNSMGKYSFCQCRDCQKECHDHYIKAWRKVK